jgi:PEP-CTERM motif
MLKLLPVVAFALVLPASSQASPCLPGTLTDYIALGSTGCELGHATVSDFTSVAILAGTEILPAAVRVTPVPGAIALDFGLAESAGAGDLLSTAFKFFVSGSRIVGNRLSLSGATAAGDGNVTGLEIKCVDGTFLLPDPSFCTGTELDLIVARDALGLVSPDVEFFAPASFFDVFVELAVDGGVAGSASLDGAVRSTFVPEPSLLLVFGSGLAAALARRRRRRSSIR